MLKLKRVELQGFKSFCDRSELKFNGAGIAAVVGPNGCGKSNLSDAISWVLGEQSAKTLRGARMEDVIFAGTRTRKPLGMAAVTLTLLDPEELNGPIPVSKDGTPEPAPHGMARGGELTITRRLFRSGESEYLINGHTARLRDIQDLFMGSGLGPESYAIIEQGRIGQILSSKPQDRRNVIEEAAGITKYKSRRRLAEAKLESAKQNLARVYDILQEVERQVNSLKRQAAKAKRYGELKEEMTGKLRIVLSGKYKMLVRVAAKAALDLNVAAGELKQLAENVGLKDEEHTKVQASAYENEKVLTESRQQLAGHNVELTRTKGRLEAQVKESGAIEQRIAQGERDIQEMEARLAKLEAEINGHRGNLNELEQLIAVSREHMLQKNQQRDVLTGKLRERERAIEQGRQSVLRLLGEAATLKNQLAQIDEYLAGIDREKARVKREDETVTIELERLNAATEVNRESMQQRQSELEAVMDDRKRTEEELSVRRRSSVEVRQKIDGLKTETSQLGARKDSLEQVLQHRTYTTDTVKKLFGLLEKGRAPELKPLGVLADFVEVDPQFEKPAEAFLHDELEYVVVENWEQAAMGLDFVKSEIEGRVTFMVEPETEAYKNGHLPEPVIGPETGIVARLSDSLKLTNGLSGRTKDILPRAGLCFLAEDREAAQRLAVSYPHLYFLLADGICVHGHSLTGGKKTASGPLAMKREARECGVRLIAKEKELTREVSLLEEISFEIAALENDLERFRQLQQAREKERVALEHESRKLSEEIHRANNRLQVSRLELERLERDSEKSLEQRDRNRVAVAEKEALRAQREEALEVERGELEKLEAESGRLTEEHSTLRAELAQFEERLRGERNALQRLDQQFRETANHKVQVAQQIEQAAAHRSQLLADNIELDRRASLLAEQIAQFESQVNLQAAEEARLREALRLGEEELKQLRSQVEAAYETKNQIEIGLVKKQSDLNHLDETAQKELGISVLELATEDETVPDLDALTEAEKVYLEVRAKIESLGAVNPDAWQEFQESSQRFEFLSVQRADLIQSIKDTEKAIQEIEQISRHKFTEAFAAINENFRGMFSTLFGGGQGEMRLTDEANANESGIDIVASPPGKKLQNVLLLSGGEKALAAVALLMAIFKYQPSPFCIMDEVDAPLDESNIGRLTKLLKEMSAQTQFILITHSKKTMESAQTMYGVTMQEPGVSKLVSVKFQQTPQAIPA